MRFFKIEGLGDQRKLNEHVVISKDPSGLGLKSYFMAKGLPIAKHYPEDASIQLQDDCPGLLLTSYLSNTVTLLFFNTECKQVIEEVCADQEIEFLPFNLIDHKGNPYSDDYWLINPLGTFNCLDRQASEISYMDDDPSQDVLSVKSFVFQKEKMDKAPHLFRVPEQPYEYFITETLGKALIGVKPTNLMITEITLN